MRERILYALEARRDAPNETPPQLELYARIIPQDNASATREIEKSNLCLFVSPCNNY